MSKHDKVAKLKEYIKNFVIKELEKDEELEEVSTTATAGIDGTGTGHYDTPHAFSSGSSVGHKSPEVGGYKKVNESYSAIFIEISKAIKANRPDELNAIKDLGEEYDIGRVLYMARTNPKALRKAVDYRAKERKQFIKGKKLKEVTKQEVNALRNLVKGIGNLKKDFSKATYIGDKELRKKDYNKHYETLLDAEKAMVKLMQLFKNKEMLGEGLNEGKNDKILDKIADIVKGASSFMNIGRELDKNRIKYTFGTKMIPMYIIEKPVKIVIINKKYVSGAERVVGSTAIGVMESIKESINEGRYHDWRNDESLTPKQKIGRSIREVRNSLNELNKTINMNLKLKTELQVDSRDYWKTTHKALSGISEKLVKLAGKVGNLK